VLDGLGFIHHPLRARTSERYIEAGLELLEEVQRTGDIFFPERWVSTILAGHQTSSAAEVVTHYLEENRTLSSRLRGKVLQAYDGLERAALISEAVH
jgi:aminopeptidase N